MHFKNETQFLSPDRSDSYRNGILVLFSGRDRYNGGIPIVIGTGGGVLKSDNRSAFKKKKTLFRKV